MSKISLFISLIWFIIVTFSLARKTEMQVKGPYRSTLIAVKKCNKTALPIIKNDPPVIIEYEMYTRNKLNFARVNLTLKRDIHFFKAKAEGYLWDKGKWRPHIMFSEMSCKNPIVQIVIRSWTTRKTTDECTILKGKYKKDGIEPNFIDHLWAENRVYGRVLWKLQLNTADHTLACVVAEIEVKPVK